MKTTMNNEITSMLQNPDFLTKYLQGGFTIPLELKEPVYYLFDIGESQGFRQLSFAESAKSAWLDYLVLALFSIIPMAVAFFRFMVYDPR